MKEFYQKESNKNSLEEIIKKSIEVLNSNTEKSKLEKVIRDGYCDTFINIDWSQVRLNRTAFINKALSEGKRLVDGLGEETLTSSQKLEQFSKLRLMQK